MLTKTDLDQIRKVIRQEVKVEVKDSTQTLEGQIRLSRLQLQSDIGGLDDRIKNVEIKQDDVSNKVDKIQKDVQILKTSVKRIRHDQGSMLDLLDGEQMQQRKRITRLEKHAGFPIPQ
jgi:peptidoglycan hydrolase CwlO-like protein